LKIFKPSCSTMNNSSKHTKNLFNLMEASLLSTPTSKDLNHFTRNIALNNMAGNLHNMANHLDHPGLSLLLQQTVWHPHSPLHSDKVIRLQLQNIVNLSIFLLLFLLVAGALVTSVEKSVIKRWTATIEWTLPSKSATYMFNWLPTLQTPPR